MPHCLFCNQPIHPTNGAIHRPTWSAHIECVVRWKTQHDAKLAKEAKAAQRAESSAPAQ